MNGNPTLYNRLYRSLERKQSGPPPAFKGLHTPSITLILKYIAEQYDVPDDLTELIHIFYTKVLNKKNMGQYHLRIRAGPTKETMTAYFLGSISIARFVPMFLREGRKKYGTHVLTRRDFMITLEAGIKKISQSGNSNDYHIDKQPSSPEWNRYHAPHTLNMCGLRLPMTNYAPHWDPYTLNHRKGRQRCSITKKDLLEFLNTTGMKVRKSRTKQQLIRDYMDWD